MYNDQKVIVVMPAYNAARTLVQTHGEVMSQGVVDLVIVVDDASRDETTSVARTLPNTIVHTHPANLGYGGNQKTCYRLAMEHGADIVIMVHPDYQYTPKLIPAMTSMIANGVYSCVIGSRILGAPCAGGRDASVEVRGQSRADAGGEFPVGHEAFGISHGIPGIFAEAAGEAAAGCELERLRLRQPDAGGDHLAR